MRRCSCLWGVLCFLLLPFLKVQLCVAGENRIIHASSTKGVEITGRGNLNEPLLRLVVEVEKAEAITWKSLQVEMSGTASANDVTRMKVYSTGSSDVFDSRRVAEYVKLGECVPRKGMFNCPLAGVLPAGRHYVWITCDVSDKAIEGHRIELGVPSVTTSRGTYRLEKPLSGSSCEILLARKLLYAPGDLGSRNYRIPAIVTAPDGSLVVATDKRKANQTDLPEDIDVLINRSVDGGKTWSEALTIAEGTGRFAGYGDAALARTGEDGGLICIFVGGTGFFESTTELSNRTYICKSSDNGQTWTSPKDITGQLFGKGCADAERSKWQGSFCASGAGLLGRDGTIYFVAAVRETSRRKIEDIANYVYYSEDKGETWKVSSCVKPDWGNEAKIVELNDGTLLVSIRNQAKGARYYATSKDKGKSWSEICQWTEMIEPGCDGDLIYYTSVKDGYSKNRLLHSVPNHPTMRKNVSVFLSYDEGKSWPVKKTICAGGSAYSSLCILQDGTIGMYTEENEGTEDFSMYFTNFSLNWLTDGKDSLSPVKNGAVQAPDKEDYYVKHLRFPEGATPEQKLDMASRLVPTPQQLEWQQMELTAFLHFGVNTFTGREWGDGSEDPAIFLPAGLDCEQWVRALKEGGFKMAILTAKHHDGFCLWPTKTTKHSVASSSWREGKGDVVRELRDACDKYGLKFGVYLSPWDRNAPCYGDSPAYNQFFIEQLTELLTNYGEVHEVWFDGANAEGPNGKKQVYDWEAILKTIRRLQPKAVTAIMGDDVRWVGNEKGIGRETEWSATVLAPGIYPHSEELRRGLGISGKAKDLGGSSIVVRAKELFWYPSEVDVSIRPGWFYHADQDSQVKSLSHLVDIYFKSVGYNSVLLLNIPPDRRGLIHENDVQRLKELSTYLKKTFAQNYAWKGKGLWKASSGASRQYEVQKGALVNTFLIQEDISKGQRVESFLVEGYKEGVWFHIAEGTTVGYKRLIRFSDSRPERIRVTIRAARGVAHVSAVGLYYAEPLSEKNEELKLSDIPVDEWSVMKGDSDSRLAMDGDRKTVWRSSSLAPLVVDMGREADVNGFCYAPPSGEDLAGTIYKYAFYVSLDGRSWTKCEAAGEFSNIMHNPVPYFVRFGKTYPARYFKLEPLAEINGRSCVAIAEIGVLADKALPKDDETLVYDRPGAPLAVTLGSADAVKPGTAHPKLKNWRFFTAHEFLDRDTKDNLPLGFIEHRGRHMSRTARVDNARCSEVKNGILSIRSVEETDSIDNGFGDKVKYSHACYRTSLPGSREAWCDFTENMRIEIRFKRTPYVGFNDALWLMGNNDHPWPKKGEIDLLENPKKTLNNRAHFTLHSENHYAGVVGGSGSITSSIELADMSRWNIYWMEWFPDRIVGGVNGQTYFEHRKGTNGNTDWPWSDPLGFFLIFSTGISTNPAAWPGAIVPAGWKKDAMPAMYIDWIRVYVNNDYKGQKAGTATYY